MDWNMSLAPGRARVATIVAIILGLATPTFVRAQAPAPAPSRPPNGPSNFHPLVNGRPAPQVITTPSRPPTQAAAEALELSRAFAEVAERVLPSVVSIQVESELDREDIPPFLLPFLIPDGHGRMPIVRGGASGVIVREDGVILTNHHVVNNARRIEVRLRDGRSFQARMIGTDPATDLALIKIEAHGLQPAQLGDSDQARVGEWVLAIGAPLGLEASVTQGVLSAKGRGGIGAADIEDYLQTDASIHPGNSGGPLVNLRGEVLGINSIIIGRGTGIGFAVPSRIAQTVTEQILRNGKVSRASIAAGVQDLSPNLARTMDITGIHQGAVINQVQPGGPAARAGLRVGDVITAIDGQAVTDSSDLVRAVTRHRVGDRVTLTVVRSGRPPQTVSLVTIERPDPARQRAMERAARRQREAHTPRARGGGPPPIGLRLIALPPELASRLGVPAEGMAVLDVDPGSPADLAGLELGDIILRADGQPVRTNQDLLNATRDGKATLLVRRGEQQTLVPLLLEE